MKKQILLFICTLWSCVLTAQTVTVQIISPVQGQLVIDSVLHVVVAASSSVYEIATVVATVNGRQASLTYDPQSNYFKGDLSLPGLPANTPLDLQVTATDAGNVKKTANTSFSYVIDQKPTIVVDLPLNASNANPLMHIKARCVDNGNCTLNISIYKGVDLVSLYYDQNFNNSVDSLFNLSAGEGWLGFIEFTATDSYGQKASKKVYISVESSPYLTKIFTADGYIRDFNFGKVLTSKDSVGKITDIISGQSTIIPAPIIPDGYPQYTGGGDISCLITGHGAIFYDNPVYGLVKDWNNGTLNTFGAINSAFSLLVRGEYASWSSDDGSLYLRDLKNKTNTNIGYANNWNNDLTANGIMAYQGSGYNIYKFENNISTPVTTNAGGKWNTYPLTDGTNIVFRKHDPCCGDQQYSLYLHDGTTETELSNFGLTEPNPKWDYQVNNKWIAYTKKGPQGILQVWLRDSIGNQSQKTFFNTSSRLDKLDSKGNFTFIDVHNTRYFVNKESGQLVPISAELGKTYYIDSTWYLTLGSGLYKIDVSAKLYISVADGNWNDPSVWPDNIVPPPGANVVIRTNVVCNVNTTCYTLKVFGPGSLIVNSGVNITILH